MTALTLLLLNGPQAEAFGIADAVGRTLSQARGQDWQIIHAHTLVSDHSPGAWRDKLLPLPREPVFLNSASPQALWDRLEAALEAFEALALCGCIGPDDLYRVRRLAFRTKAFVAGVADAVSWTHSVMAETGWAAPIHRVSAAELGLHVESADRVREINDR